MYINGKLPKLGKLPAKRDYRTLKLAKYTASLPAAPDSVDLTAKITDLGMMLNDKLGDCVIASGGHQIQAWTAEAGHQVILPDSVIEQAYSAVTGYVPGDESTDNGTNILDFLNYWRQTGISGHKIGAFAEINPKNQDEVKKAIYYFQGAALGVLLPIAAQGQGSWTGTPTDDPDTVPGSWGGHGIPALRYRYTPSNLSVLTWGAFLNVDWDFLAAYCDEAYALISQDQLNGAGKTPEGFDWQALQSDLQEITQ